MFQLVLLQFRVLTSDSERQNPIVNLTDNLNSLSYNGNDDVKFCKTFRLLRKCEYSQLVFFASHFVDFAEYRKLVLATFQCAVNDAFDSSLISSDFSSWPVIPIKLTVCFSITNCDIISLIDHAWSSNILKWAVLRMEIEEALSWLSTLGGAYSSLGDRNINFAKKAGQISMSQLRLSYVYGDPNLIARCFIYMSHSLCQQGHKKKAIKFVKKCLYPRLVELNGNCERIVSQMYRSLSFRIKFIYK